jgi:hypothetical protein
MVRRPKEPCRGRESFILGVLIVQLDLDIRRFGAEIAYQVPQGARGC